MIAQSKRDLETAWLRAQESVMQHETRLATALLDVSDLIEYCRAGEIPSDALACPVTAAEPLKTLVREYNGYVLNRSVAS